MEHRRRFFQIGPGSLGLLRLALFCWSSLIPIFSKGFLNGMSDIGSGASPHWGMAASQKETLCQEMVLG
jgi:hypothetical protein